MSKFNFSKRSLDNLATVEPTLQLVAHTMLEWSEIDFAVICGHRTIEDQQDAFKNGRSKIDGINKKSTHNYKPSRGMDLMAFVNGSGTWDTVYYIYLGALFRAACKHHGIDGRWGGNFDMDGDILEQDFDDVGHFQIDDTRFR